MRRFTDRPVAPRSAVSRAKRDGLSTEDFRRPCRAFVRLARNRRRVRVRLGYRRAATAPMATGSARRESAYERTFAAEADKT